MSVPAPHSRFPALHLYPVDVSFDIRRISLPPDQRVALGRHIDCNEEKIASESNIYFDSDVLSRQHAEVWQEGNKIFIRDTVSFNGTFLNGERLSPQRVGSEPFELKSGDIFTLGIDFCGEDKQTVTHHKVAAGVVCVFTEQDAHRLRSDEKHQIQHPEQKYNELYSGDQRGLTRKDHGTDLYKL